MEYHSRGLASRRERSCEGVTNGFDISDVGADERDCRFGRIGVGWSVDVKYADVAFAT